MSGRVFAGMRIVPSPQRIVLEARVDARRDVITADLEHEKE